ncbi:tripartite motif-containing protein 2-like [Acanthaster planci]|uniref:Tripartite motif-containing protein 2-like n=1 Tax=Acanthaster planci TaxID=133434 RepID=A0A8B7ZYB0_ACAPL|nr:tripartite motif-containing protein 2-like [Acanthaster planci]
MAGISGKTTLDRITLGHLKCTICCKRFADPKLLECLHSFCRNCLEEQRQVQQINGLRIICSLCKRETSLTETRIEGLRDNLTLMSLVEEAGLQEQLVASQLSKIKCESCDEEQEAISRCMDCDDYLCKDCQSAHKRLSKMKNHKIATLADLRGGSVTFRSKVRATVPKCEKHSNQDICHYCNTCQKLVCTACAVGDHKAPDHDLTDPHAAMAICQKELGEHLTQAKDHKDEFEAAKLSTDHAKKRLRAMVTNAITKISKKAEEEVAKIRQRELDLKQQVKKIEDDRSSEIEVFQAGLVASLKWSKYTLDIAEDFLTQGSPFEVLELKSKILFIVKDVQKKQVPVLQHGLSFVDFKDSAVGQDGSFGKLLLEEKWEMKDEFGKRGMGDGEFMEARGIAAFSNSDLAVADPANGRVTILSSDGKYKSSISGPSENNPEGQLQKPCDVAVSTDNQLVVIDTPVVKVFNKQKKLANQFVSGKVTTSSSKVNAEEEPESDLRCIAIDCKNQIAIGDKGKRIVSLHQLDGALIKAIPAELIAKHLAIGGLESIIYTNLQARLLLASDLKGQEIFSLHTLTQENPAYEPTGVCCDSSGDIYVALQGTIKGQRGEIHHFSPKGEHIACVARGLNSPLGITFTPDGDLAVADVHNVKVYQRV